MHVAMYRQPFRLFPSANGTSAALKIDRNGLPRSQPVGRWRSHQVCSGPAQCAARATMGQSGTRKAILLDAVLVKHLCSASLYFARARIRSVEGRLSCSLPGRFSSDVS